MTEATIDDHDVLLSALSRFAAMLVSPYRVSDAMDELTRSVTEVLELDGAGVTLAKGVVAGPHDIGTDAAFERIRSYARRNRITVPPGCPVRDRTVSAASRGVMHPDRGVARR